MRRCVSSNAEYLLRELPVGKDFFDSNIEFTQIVLSKPISVPADSFKKKALLSNDGEVE